jgi:hypothetical protein
MESDSFAGGEPITGISRPRVVVDYKPDIISPFRKV